MSIAVDGTHTESVLNKLSMPQLAQLLINAGINISNSHITANNIFKCTYFEYMHEYLKFEYFNIKERWGLDYV